MTGRTRTVKEVGGNSSSGLRGHIGTVQAQDEHDFDVLSSVASIFRICRCFHMYFTDRYVLRSNRTES